MSTEKIQKQLNAVTGHASSGNWQGFRSVLLNAAHVLGAEVNAGRMAQDEAAMRLGAAIRTAGRIPNADDRRWIAQGLEDTCAGAADPREDLGRLARDVWAKGCAFGSWEDLGPDVKDRFMAIGKALYDAGFEAGADSVNHV